MRKLLLNIAFFLPFILSAQNDSPVKWESSFTEVGDGEIEVVLKATIGKGWHMYAASVDPNAGPIPTSFTLEESVKYKAQETLKEGKPIIKYDPNFMVDLAYFEESASFTQRIKVQTTDGFTLKGKIEYMICNDEMCMPPEIVEVSLDIPAQSVSFLSMETILIFFKGFLGGFAALLMPCVFPLIPLTVSFFTKQNEGKKKKGLRNAIIYGISIVVIYVSLGFGVTVTFGADALNVMSTDPWFNIAFFVLFTIFAISFFGVFEITLPSALVNGSDKMADKGGLLGIFFMAFTLALVSFSCTGPIIGTLLYDAAINGGIGGPIAGMLGFSLALALPFTVFSASPELVKNLPASGGWLNEVKVSFGFLELAFALKFLSNADLVWQLGVLKREIFIGFWIIIFFLFGIYLIGLIRFSSDSPVRSRSPIRTSLSLMVIAFSFYLIPGLWGKNLGLVSGLTPPLFYSLAGEEHCPLNLDCLHDYEEALQRSKEWNKPILVDFTGWACANCRKMEENVWNKPEILPIIKDKYILVSLYVDERKLLPKEEQYTSKVSNKPIKTVGNKWSDLQLRKYKSISQPFYVLIDADEHQLANPVGYSSKEEFKAFLEEGLSSYTK